MVSVDTLVLGTRDAWQVECRGHSHEFRERIDAHLPRDPASVRLHGDLANAKPGCDLLIQQAGNHQSHGFSFALCERGVVILQCAQQPVPAFTSSPPDLTLTPPLPMIYCTLVSPS